MFFMGRRQMLSAYLTTAVSIAWYFRSRPPRVFFGGTLPKLPTPSFLTPEQVDSYHEDGYLLLRGFVSKPKELKELVKAGENIQKTFSIMDLFVKELYSKLSFQEWRNQPAFASLVFESALPSISAQLLTETRGIRLMKDALFAQSSQTRGCGWHVDDFTFWPATSNGVTAWLALSDNMQSLRLAPGSHRAEWAPTCRQAIAGGPNATCNMHLVHPECNALLENNSVSFPVQPGDVLLWDRWLFHRSEQMTTDDPKARYSARFIPQGAKARPGAANLHASVQVGQEFIGPYYPQVWPRAVQEEIEAIQKGLDPDFSVVDLARLVWKLAKMEIPKRVQAKWKEYSAV